MPRMIFHQVLFVEHSGSDVLYNLGRSILSVCMCVCLSVCQTITFESLDFRTSGMSPGDTGAPVLDLKAILYGV